MTGELQASAVLLMNRSGRIRNRLPKESGFKLLEADSVQKAQNLLRRYPSVKVILSDHIEDFESLKDIFPDPVRLFFTDHLDLAVTQTAINRGEVFRFILGASPSKIVLNAIIQGVQHFDMVNLRKRLLHDLKTQNEKLKKIIQRLEQNVHKKTFVLKSMEEQLHHSKRYLEQLNALISWINASATMEELQKRIQEALAGILPIRKAFMTEGGNKKIIQRIKKIGYPTLVIPLIYQKKNLGHLYFICKDEASIDQMRDKLDLIKQVSDTVALTLEKIKFFEVSVKRREEWTKTFDAIKDPVALVNQQYDIVRANLSYSAIAGMKIQSLVGEKCYRMFQKRETPCAGCLLQDALKEKRNKNFELQSQAQDTYYATSAFPAVPYTLGQIVMYYRNQGEEKQLRDQLIQSEKMAEIGILAGSVAHEINNPLGGILAFTQILLSEVSPKGKMHGDLKEIEKAAMRSKGIVENLLYFSRISEPRGKKRIDLAGVIEKAIALVNLKIRHRNIQIKRNFRKVPDIRGDFNQLVQVFLNLLQNAVEAVKNNGRVEISIYAIPSQREVCVKVHDDGKGIDVNQISKIFNPFFTTKNKGQHPGLGLSVSYQIVKDHGGEVKVESDRERGTRFSVRLPI